MIVASLSTGQNLDVLGLTFGSLLIVLGFIAIRTLRTLRANETIKLASRMGQGRWDFSQSFGTNISVIGSVLTVILTSSVLPRVTKILPASAFGGLAAFFGIVVIIAPLLYNGTANKVRVSPDQFDSGAEYRGTVWGFLLASLVIAWGLLGSISTAFVALLEIEYDGSLSIGAVILLAVPMLAAVVFFGRYTWVKVDGTIVDQFDPAAQSARMTRSSAVRASLALPPPTAEKPPPAPGWTVL
jgi:hypothetical protein